MLNKVNTAINDCFILGGIVRDDDRGSFLKTYCEGWLEALSIDFRSQERFYSVNKIGVIRGLHFQLPPFDHAKIVYCSNGSIIDVVVDLRKGGDYGKVFSQKLASDSGDMIYIPSGCAHGFISLEENTIINYEVSSVYSPEHDGGIHWQSIDFEWQKFLQNKLPIVSARDSEFVSLKKFDSPF